MIMKKTTNLIAIVIIFIIMFFAQEVLSKENKKMNIETVLQEEIESGVSISCEDGEGTSLEIDEEYFLLMSEVINEKLITKGFKPLEERMFIKKVYDIFHIVLDKDIKVFSVEDVTENYEEFPTKMDEGGIGLKVLDRRHRLILDIYRLPEIVNYQNKYPKLKELENQLKKSQSKDKNHECNIEWWQDFYDMDIEKYIEYEIDNTLALNNYLFYRQGNIFNLFENNKYFFIHLVVDNHYYNDLALLEIVLDEYINKFPSEISEILWSENLGKIKINKNAFQIISRKNDKERKRFLLEIKKDLDDIRDEYLKKYLEDYLMNNYT